MSRVAILYCGELGAAMARALVGRGIACTTAAAGRSAATRARAAQAGVAACASVAEAIRGADLILSLVPARAAEAVAAEVAAASAATAGAAPPLYIDANSTDPRILPRIAETVGRAGLACVDGAVVGAAARVGTDAMLLLSGAEAPRAAAFLAPALAVRVVGAAAGQASALKLALAVVTKGVVALGLEALAAARAAGAEAEAEALLRDIYPGIWDVVRRALPGYPRHVARRRAEAADAAAWITSEGLPAPMARAIAATFARVAAARLDPARDWSFEEVIAALLDADAAAT